MWGIAGTGLVYLNAVLGGGQSGSAAVSVGSVVSWEAIDVVVEAVDSSGRLADESSGCRRRTWRPASLKAMRIGGRGIGRSGDFE